MDAVGEFLCDFLLDRSLLVLIRLITDYDDPDMLIGVGPHLLEPSLQILKRLVTGDIEHQQCHNRTKLSSLFTSCNTIL